MAATEHAGASPSGGTATAKRKRYGCLVAALVVAAGLAYPPLKIRWARARVRQLCSEARPGSGGHDLEARARDLGLQVMAHDELREAMVAAGRTTPARQLIAWEGWVFARATCSVTIVDGIVSESRVGSLD